MLSIGGRPVDLPDGADLARLRIEVILGALIDGLGIEPVFGSATVIAPAAGVCGPATAGPVDAVRIGDSWSGDTVGVRPVAWSARVITVQQSRCWLVVADFVGGWPDGTAITGDLAVLPAMVCADTARASQFQLDRGRGPDWPEALLLDTPRARGRRLPVLAMCSDGLVAAQILDRALSKAEAVGRA
ncbi:hypothetical protein IRY44_02170 [Micromonospora sp. ANENR4]|uniref:hypothetical protein n=1 Tax=unclassified Micromonospora TaxID=2617518 RepID=UPI00188FFAAC|nr:MULTISPECIES: hypothetical protein [unclassified Micromonospora]MBF5028533.1 hypothetical protein [Micromonospora sp. ANENR4]MCZ7472994.1 hypothetical protein [Micromonospora sp. WMMC273]